MLYILTPKVTGRLVHGVVEIHLPLPMFVVCLRNHRFWLVYEYCLLDGRVYHQ